MKARGSLVTSFRCAGRGIWLAGGGRNLRIMLVAFVAVVALGAVLDISAVRWTVIVVCGSLVLTAEVLNTSIEVLADRVQREFDEDIRTVKDLAAGAVLVSALLAAVVGVIVFWPYVVE